MARHRPELPDDVRELLDILQKGKLFALQDWIKSGKRIHTRDLGDYRAQMLRMAVDTGFHSLVEELLRVGGWQQDELADALSCAFEDRRSDLCDLLLAYGAKLAELDFETICRTVDVNLMERFLREGGDPCRDNAFARALRDMKARPLLRFFKSFRAEFPALDDQAALALHQAVADDQVRWTALLTWAGADPFRPVPWDFEGSFPVDPEDATCAATRATWRNNPDIFKVLKLKPNVPQAIELLEHAVSSGNYDLFRTVLKQVPPDQINNTPLGSCAVLEKLVGRWASHNVWSNTRTTDGDAAAIQCLQLLLDAGARWIPPADEIHSARRALRQHEPRYIVQVLRLLLYTPGAADIGSVIQLCDSKPLRSKIAEADQQLVQEIKELSKQHRQLATNTAGS